MNILYIAYSCDPYKGSEDQIGWNIPYEAEKKGNTVYVITKIEQKDSIELYCKKNNYNRITFYYVDISKYIKKVCNGQFYSARFLFWMKNAYELAKSINEDMQFDIIHQITPIELRAIGDFGKIDNSKYVVGPLGGGVRLPSSLNRYAHKKIVFERIRLIMNSLAMIKYKLKGTLKNVDYFLFSNEETKNYFRDFKGDICSELGIEEYRIKKDVRKQRNKKVVFIVVGRLIYIKGHEFLFHVLNQIPANYEYEVRIIGDGPYQSTLQEIVNSSKNLNKHVVFLGKVDYTRMQAEYDEADILIHPSIRDNSGNVLIEALSSGKPIIAMNSFGSKVILDSNDSWLYSGKNHDELAENFKASLIEAIENENLYSEKSKAAIVKAHKYTWEKKYLMYEEVYTKLLGKSL